MYLQDQIKTLKLLSKKNGGYFRFKEAIHAGISQPAFYKLRDKGIVLQESRGLYSVAGEKLHPYPDYSQITLKVPKGVVFLISALSFHEITTEIPQQMNLALLKGSRTPLLDYPPASFYHISEPSFSAGIEIHNLQGIKIKVYSVEKTIADCFKFRGSIGLNIAVESLKLYRERKKLKVSEFN